MSKRFGTLIFYDSDIATIEALHDCLLDLHGLKLESRTLTRARELTKRMYNQIQNND